VPVLLALLASPGADVNLANRAGETSLL